MTTTAPTSNQLRDYQVRGLEEIKAQILPAQRVIYQLPTGGGKTVVGVALGREWIDRFPAGSITWMTHRRELVRQSGEVLNKYGLPAMRTNVTTPLKLRNAIRKMDGRGYTADDLLIVDEAHHSAASTWSTIIRGWPGPVLGLTATPWRMSKREGLDHLFNNLICGPTVRELKSMGWLVEVVIKHPRDGEVIRGLGHNSTSGDFNQSATMRQSRTILVEHGIEWLIAEMNAARPPRRFKTIVYCIHVEHAQAVASYAQARGLRSGLLLGNTPTSDREQIDADFRAGKLDTLVNAEVVTEGYDCPDADCELMLRPTLSLALYLQMAGRVARPAEGKNFGLILDACENHLRFGLPDEDHPWTLAPRTSEISDGESPVRVCPVCHAIQSASSRKCASCGHPFGHICRICGSWQELRLGQQPPERCGRCDLQAQMSLFQQPLLNESDFTHSFRIREDQSFASFYVAAWQATFWYSYRSSGELSGGVKMAPDSRFGHHFQIGEQESVLLDGEGSRFLEVDDEREVLSRLRTIYHEMHQRIYASDDL